VPVQEHFSPLTSEPGYTRAQELQTGLEVPPVRYGSKSVRSEHAGMLSFMTIVIIAEGRWSTLHDMEEIVQRLADSAVGKVLIDNSTAFGAKYAYEAWPPTIDDWLIGTNALNLRSLMDILEAIVLHDRLVLDSSSRAIPKEYGEPGWVSVWDKLDELQDRDGQDILAEVAFGYEPDFFSPVVKAALATLGTYIRNKTFARELQKFQQDDIDFILPRLYRTPAEFSELFVQSIPGFDPGTPDTDILEHLKLVEHSLENSSPQESSYAMFAFRGFYYLELAHLLSISYSPHTWRSNLVKLTVDRAPINFAKYVTQVTGQVRQELASRLNNEFGTSSFSSEFPVIAAYTVGQASHREQLFDVAVDIRNSPPVVAFREWIKEVQSSIVNQNDLPTIAQAKSDLQTIVTDMRKELGLANDENSEKVTIKLGIPGTASLEAPVPMSYDSPIWLRRIFHRRPHLVFLRDITRSSVSLSPFAQRYYQLEP
jgi:hypothetical protein